jgi:hypothetical protein
MVYTIEDYHKDLDAKKEAIRAKFKEDNRFITEEKIEFLAKNDLPPPPNDGWSFRD